MKFPEERMLASERSGELEERGIEFVSSICDLIDGEVAVGAVFEGHDGVGFPCV